MSETLPVYNRHEESGPPSVLICEGTAATCAEELSRYDFGIFEPNRLASPAEVIDYIRKHRINYLAGVRSNLKVRGPDFEKLFAESPHLVGVGRGGVGVDNIDLNVAACSGLIVQNTPKASTRAVGEHAVALAQSLLKRTGPNSTALQSGKWEKQLTREMRGQNVVIVGTGRIGRDAASKFHALGCHVKGYDPYERAPAFLFGVTVDGVSGKFLEDDELDDFDLHQYMPLVHDRAALLDILHGANIVSLHPAGDDPTQPAVLGKEEIAALPNGAAVINTSRSWFVDDDALIGAVEKRDFSVGLDVLPHEGKGYAEDSVVARYKASQAAGKNVLITHHTAGNSEPAQDRIGAELARTVKKLFVDGEIRNSVTLPDTSRGRTRENSRPRVFVVNKDRPGATALVAEALRGVNLHAVPFNAAPKPMAANRLDVLGYEIDLNGGTPVDVAAEVRTALEALYRNSSAARELLIRANIL